MKIEIKREAQTAWMILKEKVIYQGDYQMKMMEEISMSELLPLRLEGREEETSFLYHISGLTSVQNYYQQHVLDKKEMMQLAYELAETAKKMSRYLLEADRLVLNPACIYRTPDHFLFCYLPIFRKPFSESFHQLTEYFVRELDYEDPDAIQTACRLHKYTMQDNYSLAEVVKKVQEELESISRSTGKMKEKQEEWEKPAEWEEEDAADEDIEEIMTPGNRRRNRADRSGRRRKKKMSKWGEWENL